jgi:non-ribosomal peptide synthetase component F
LFIFIRKDPAVIQEQDRQAREPGTTSGAYLPQFPGSAAAPPQRTLMDILEDTVGRFPEASALDDGRKSLSYAELLAAVRAFGRTLHGRGLGAGDKIGVRIPSGSNDLYVAILGILLVGAAYVPVDADDPEDRARLVFGEAQVAGTVTAGAGRGGPR